MKCQAWLVLASLLFVTGCIPLTLSPLYRGDDDIVSVEGLEGQWVLQDEDKLPANWEFTREEGQPGYRLTIRAEAQGDAAASTAEFRVAPIELEGRQFLDVLMQGHEPELNFWFAIHILPARSVWRMELKDGSLQLASTNQKALLPMLREKPDATPHRVIKDEGMETKDEHVRVLLLGDTDELRRFVATLDDATYFTADPLQFTRAPVAAPAEPAAP